MHEGGAPGSPAVVLVHGIGVSGRYFAPLARELAPRARVLTLDLPGFGRAARPREALTVAEHAAAVRSALAARGVQGAVLVGHSLGCQVVAHLLRDAPGTASGAVLVGPTVDERARTARAQGLRLVRDTAAEPPRLAGLILRECTRCGVRRYLRTVGHMLADRIEDVLPEAAVPVLVLRGEHDPVAPRAWTHRLAALAPQGRAAEVAGARHVVQWTHPAELAGACLGLARA